ncbi:MAG: hypothetical protein ACE14M_07875 [Terriglobales bacterium]
MLLTCTKCQVKNYLDPYPFWNFDGTTKCAGCAQVYKIKVVNGIPQGAPTPTTGKADLLPGFAERGHEPISGPGLTRPAPRARKDSVCRPIPLERNIKGTPLSGKPLKKEDLVGSKPKFMVAGAK